MLFVAPWMSEELFAGTVAALNAARQPQPALFKDMECAQFVDPTQWREWTLATEVAAIDSLRQRVRANQLDLVGYSGGAASAVAYAVAHPERLASLTLIEPPWIGSDVWSEEEAAFREAYERLAETPSKEVWRTIAATLNAPATPVPPAPAAEPEDLRNAFLGVWRGYLAEPLDRGRLRQIASPVYLPVGQGSAARMHTQAEYLASCFPNARVEIYEGAGHFDLPLVAAQRLADGLSQLWKKSP